jgi:hypothetical protein
MLVNAKARPPQPGMTERTDISKNEAMPAECVFPQRMQRFGRKLVDAYIDNQMSTAEFLRQLTLTNSNYLDLGQCIVGIYEKNPTQ